MAMTVGSQGSGKIVAPQMNVTPLVDVVLVLLIIFMVVTPLMSSTFFVHTPKQKDEDVPPEEVNTDPTPPLVLHVGADKVVQVNGQPIEAGELPDRLRRMFAARQDHVIFFDADDRADYGFSVEVMDKAREGGAVTIATLTQALGAPKPAAAGEPAPDAAPDAAPATSPGS